MSKFFPEKGLRRLDGSLYCSKISGITISFNGALMYVQATLVMRTKAPTYILDAGFWVVSSVHDFQK